MEDLFTIEVPQEDLDAPRGGGSAMKAGRYRSTLQPGAQVISGKNGWQALQLPFSGFEALKAGNESYPQRTAEAKFTCAHDTNADVVKGGRERIIGAARALGLTQEITNADGKKAFKLTANSIEELVEQFNSVAGSQVGVYVTSKPSQNLKSDGTPFYNNDIANVFALDA